MSRCLTASKPRGGGHSLPSALPGAAGALRQARGPAGAGVVRPLLLYHQRGVCGATCLDVSRRSSTEHDEHCQTRLPLLRRQGSKPPVPEDTAGAIPCQDPDNPWRASADSIGDRRLLKRISPGSSRLSPISGRERSATTQWPALLAQRTHAAHA
jgi:hypothetical protein